MDIRVEFDNVPNEIAGIIKELHEEFKVYYPKWAQTVSYSYRNQKEDSEQTVAENYTSYPYRRVAINIYSNFLHGKEDYRREVFLHEVLHTVTGVFTVPVFDIVEKLIKDEDCKHIVLNELVDKVESFTQDLTYCVLNHYAAIKEKEADFRSLAEAKSKKSTKPSQEQSSGKVSRAKSS